MNPSNTKSEAKHFLDSYEEALNTFSLPDRLTGQYVLSDCLKHSGHKEIYLLSDRQGNLYVLKREQKDRSMQLKQEYQMFGLLEGSDAPLYIPECKGYWEEAEWCYLLRTYIEGDSLAAYRETHPVLSCQEVIGFSLAICELIQILHDKKPPIIHRDIKPENFILQKDTHRLYLIDFDTARQYIPEKNRDTQLIGTPDFAAPEQFGFYQSDIQTDIYGIGKTMLCLIAGTTAEEGLQDPLVPHGLRKIICRAAAFSPEKRYSSVAELQRDLQKYKKRQSALLPLRRMAVGVLLFLLGLGIGFFMGRFYPGRSFDAADKDKIADTGNEDNAEDTENTADALQDKGENGNTEDAENVTDTVTNAGSDKNGTNTEHAQNAGNTKNGESTKDSLLSASGAKQVNLWKYQKQVDAIILSYYNAEYDTMFTQMEMLVRDLYADDALMQVSGEDYSVYETLPSDFWEKSALSTIRLRLAYRDQILRKNLGSYQKHEKNILSLLELELSQVQSEDDTSSLNRYATLTAEERDDNYEFALSDLLGTMNGGFDLTDGFQEPH